MAKKRGVRFQSVIHVFQRVQFQNVFTLRHRLHIVSLFTSVRAWNKRTGRSGETREKKRERAKKLSYLLDKKARKPCFKIRLLIMRIRPPRQVQHVRANKANRERWERLHHGGEHLFEFVKERLSDAFPGCAHFSTDFAGAKQAGKRQIALPFTCTYVSTTVVACFAPFPKCLGCAIDASHDFGLYNWNLLTVGLALMHLAKGEWVTTCLLSYICIAKAERFQAHTALSSSMHADQKAQNVFKLILILVLRCSSLTAVPRG